MSGILFKRELFLSASLDRIEKMKLCGDWFSYVMMAEKTNVLFCPEIHSFYRKHDNNISSGLMHQGLSFLEGKEILDYINCRYKIPKLWMSAKWGNYLASSCFVFDFEDDVKKLIIDKFRSEFFLIILFYYIFWIRWKIHFALHSSHITAVQN